MIGTRRVLLGGGVREALAARAARYGVVFAPTLDEVSGDRVDAVSGFAMLDNNTVTSTAGKVGLAAQFTAANSESLSITDKAILSIGNVDVWGCCWVNMATQPGQATIMSKMNPGTNKREYELYYANSFPGKRFVFWGSSDGTGGTEAVREAATFGAPATATDYFIMWYYDSVDDKIGISVNGGPFDLATLSGGMFDSDNGFRLGARSTNAFFWDGWIDLPYIGKPPGGFATAPPAEIRDYIYNGGAGRQWPWGF